MTIYSISHWAIREPQTEYILPWSNVALHTCFLENWPQCFHHLVLISFWIGGSQDPLSYFALHSQPFSPNVPALLGSDLQEFDSPWSSISIILMIKSVTISTFPPSVYHEMMGPDVMIFVFWILSFNPAFSLSPFTLIRMLYISSSLSAIRVASFT